MALAMETDKTSQSRLPLISEKRLQQPIQTDLVAFCPVHDLIANVTETCDLIVYRLGGQVAFTVKRGNSNATITTLAWNAPGTVLGRSERWYNGSLTIHVGSQIAVAWSDGTYTFMSGENGRLLSSYSTQGDSKERPWTFDLNDDGIRPASHGNSKVVCLGWMNHITDASTLDHGLNDILDALDDPYSENGHTDDATKFGDVDVRGAMIDLPRALITMNADDVLPRLSAIPSHFPPTQPKRVAQAARFVTQASVDTIMSNERLQTENLDVLLVGERNGTIQVLLDETVKMGSVAVPDIPILHTSHAVSSTHAIISQSGSSSDPSLRLNLVTLPLRTLGGPLLSVVSLNTKQLKHLLDYVIQTLRCMQHDWTDGLRLPGAWIANINEDLAEKHEGDLSFGLMELAMTGHFKPTMLEWLVDTIQEQVRCMVVRMSPS